MKCVTRQRSALVSRCDGTFQGVYASVMFEPIIKDVVRPYVDVWNLDPTGDDGLPIKSFEPKSEFALDISITCDAHDPDDRLDFRKL